MFGGSLGDGTTGLLADSPAMGLFIVSLVIDIADGLLAGSSVRNVIVLFAIFSVEVTFVLSTFSAFGLFAVSSEGNAFVFSILLGDAS